MGNLKICIVNYEGALGINGILTKYAKEMYRELIDMEYNVTLRNEPDPEADINHHINYLSFKPSGTIDTTMITHVTGDKNQTEKQKLAIIKKQKATGICFSEAMQKKVGGEVVLPAHDSLPRRPRIIAIATNLYPDGRKNEKLFTNLIKSLKDQNKFTFRIMGLGWKKTLDSLLKTGIKMQWLDHFEREMYHELLQTSDYLLYTGGEDAPAQSIIDAKQSGLRIIAQPQDDLEVELPFTNQEELNSIFAKMEENPVEKWTWENYVKAHLIIWETLYAKSKSKAPR